MINKKNTILFSLIISVLTLSSCSVFFQRGYVATSPNVNCFETEKEKNFKLSAFINHFEGQTNLAFSKHFGLSAAVNGGFRGQIGADIAGIYYNKFNDKNYFEVQCGYGYYNNYEKIHSMAWSLFAGERGTYFSNNSATRYHKIFVQPSYFLTWDKVNLGFALKLSANYFDKYHYYSCVTKQDYEYDDYYYTADFRYKWGLVIEPAIKLELKRILFFQLSGIFSSNVQSFQAYHDYTSHEGHLINRYNDYMVKSPQHISFVFTIGHEFKFGKKNKL